ncbi:RidA family protein [Mesorhizobium sp. B2-8-9]|uniref:RidA family protein n=1 Tax=Mesorhizobium sp. B2-8-9 TaxID=2589899 RepID=UPI00112D4CFE|nr:RidA family protein [Mesorhizobium sp. B2-8-9]TPI68373.1 RidA family protein [Mesorhizobium sp. B2-8-9]
MTIERLNPQGMHSNPAYSQGVSLPASARIVLVGGQNGVDAEGNIVGKGDLAAQTMQALANLAKVLEAGGAKLEDLVSLSVYIVGDQDIASGFGAWMALWANRAPPPIIKALRVVGLGNPDFLIEIEGQAAVA